MEEHRDSFLETIKFDVANSIEQYNMYLYDYRNQLKAQAVATHSAIMEEFPELDFTTICRIKSFESTMDKIKRKGFDKVYDIHGLKHIIYGVNDSSDEATLTKYCYILKDFIENYYTKKGCNIITERTKDYIQNPKENGYRALHLSGQKGDRKFETQIKTANMEQIAKYGNANHSEIYKPRAIGKYPILKLPRYFTVVTQNSAPFVKELTLDECFQYFYNIPYEKYKEKIDEDIVK